MSWSTARLGDLVTFSGGGTPNRSNPSYFGGDIPWVTPKDMKSWEIRSSEISLTEAGVQNSTTRLVDPESVLVVVRSGVLKHSLPVAINRVPVAINQDMKALRCSKALRSDYLARYLQATAKKILASVRATTADNIPTAVLQDLEVPLPPLEEQKRIAAILDAAEALRDKRRAALAEQGALLQSVFLDIFGDPAQNPKGWACPVLGDLISVGPQNGLYRPASDYGSGTPILRIDSFYDGVVTDLETLKRVRVSDDERELYRLRAGEIVINRVNSREYLGKNALIPELQEPTIFESNMMRFGVNRDKLEPVFLVGFLRTSFAKAQILQASKDAVNQSSINQQDVKALKVKIPPLTLQRLYAQSAAAINGLKTSHVASLAELHGLLAALQHRAFRGEL